MPGHSFKINGVGTLDALAVTAALAQRDADIATQGRVLVPHEEELFAAAIAAFQSFLATLDPLSLGTDIQWQCTTGCADDENFVPFLHISKSWSTEDPAATQHSWATHIKGGFDSAQQALALTLLQANLASAGRVMEAGDTSVWDALVAASIAWLADLSSPGIPDLSFNASVSDGDLSHCSVSLGITLSSPASPVSDPLAGVLTPPALTANTNDYNPTGLSTSAYIRISSTATRNLTGLATGSGTRHLVVYNVGLFTISFIAHSLLSAAGNRFLIDGNLNVGPDDAVSLVYDPVSLGWRCVGQAL